jgi:hypothetical protein
MSAFSPESGHFGSTISALWHKQTFAQVFDEFGCRLKGAATYCHRRRR